MRRQFAKPTVSIPSPEQELQLDLDGLDEFGFDLSTTTYAALQARADGEGDDFNLSPLPQPR